MFLNKIRSLVILPNVSARDEQRSLVTHLLPTTSRLMIDLMLLFSWFCFESPVLPASVHNSLAWFQAEVGKQKVSSSSFVTTWPALWSALRTGHSSWLPEKVSSSMLWKGNYLLSNLECIFKRWNVMLIKYVRFAHIGEHSKEPFLPPLFYWSIFIFFHGI